MTLEHSFVGMIVEMDWNFEGVCSVIMALWDILVFCCRGITFN